jgi:NTE family protein
VNRSTRHLLAALAVPLVTLAQAPHVTANTVPSASTTSPAPAATGTSASESTPRRPRIGLVLSGGGARGLAHIGVLKELEAARIPVDVVVGTSMGSIVGGLYASGMPPAEMERRVLAMDWSAMFATRPPREELALRRKADDARLSLPFEFGMREGSVRIPRAAVGSTGLENMLKQLTGDLPTQIHFDRLPIPFRAVATDLVTGEAVVFDEGDLAAVMRASMSVPGAFAPVEIRGRLLVDGGLVDNLPIQLARRLGAEVVIAVNIGSPLLKREEVGSIFGIGMQMINILTEQNVQRSLATLTPRDVLIVPDLAEVTSVDFDRGPKAIEQGAAATRAAVATLARYTVSDAEFVAHMRQRNAQPPPERVDEIRIEGTQSLGREIVEAALAGNLGQRFDARRVERDLAWLLGRGDFERLDYRMLNEAGRGVLLVRVGEKPWGPNFFRFGLGLSTDFTGQGQFVLIANHTRRWLNTLGAEWRNEAQIGRTQRIATEFYQPLTASEAFFVAVGAERKRRVGEVSLNFGNGATSRPFATYVGVETRAGAELGVALGRFGELRVGPIYERVSVTPQVGPFDLPAFRGVNQSGLRATLTIDQRDSATFARSGYRTDLSVHRTLTAFSAGQSFWNYRLMAEGALTWGAQTFDLHLAHARVTGRGKPEFPQFELGGLLQLSGLKSGQLRGDRLYFARLMSFRRLGSLAGFGSGIYLGGSFELGNATAATMPFASGDLVRAGSVFLGLDTAIGPVYLGYGRADRKRDSVYLLLGSP